MLDQQHETDDTEKQQKKLSPIFENNRLTPKEKYRIIQLLEDQKFYIEALANTTSTIAKIAKINTPLGEENYKTIYTKS